MKKKLIAGLVGALGLAAALGASNAQATCTINDSCKEQFGCESCNVHGSWALGISGTSWVSRTAKDINNAVTNYRARRTTAGNGGGLTVEATSVGSSFHHVIGSIGCTNNKSSEVIDFNATGSKTVTCPSGSTPVRADARIWFPDNLCPYDQICAFN